MLFQVTRILKQRRENFIDMFIIMTGANKEAGSLVSSRFYFIYCELTGHFEINTVYP